MLWGELVKAGPSLVKLILLRTQKKAADTLTKSLPSPAVISLVIMGQTPFTLKSSFSECEISLQFYLLTPFK